MQDLLLSHPSQFAKTIMAKAKEYFAEMVRTQRKYTKLAQQQQKSAEDDDEYEDPPDDDDDDEPDDDDNQHDETDEQTSSKASKPGATAAGDVILEPSGQRTIATITPLQHPYNHIHHE